MKSLFEWEIFLKQLYLNIVDRAITKELECPNTEEERTDFIVTEMDKVISFVSSNE